MYAAMRDGPILLLPKPFGKQQFLSKVEAILNCSMPAQR
jgi:hypothetical protein